LPNLHLIILDEPTANLREAFQEVVTQHSENWWHQLPDVWIVQGDTPTEWRDRFRPLRTAAGAEGQASSIWVFELPAEGRAWAAIGPDGAARSDWLYKYYTGSRDVVDKVPAADGDVPF
jgi:hypothetical protein